MKKFAALFTAVLIMASLFVGCSGSGAQTEVSGSTVASSGSTESGTAAGTSDSAGEVIELRLSQTNPATNAIGETCEELAKRVEEASSGRIKITCYHAGQLGGERDNVEACQIGDLDMAVVNMSVLANFVPELGVFDIPYLITGTDHADKVFLGDIGQNALDSLSAAQIKGIGIWESGFRNLTNSKRDINTLADVAGLRIRVMENKIHQALWRELGADPVPMAWSDAYTALQQGAIDGQENPLAVIIANNVQGVNSHLAMTEHVYNTGALIMSNKAWDSLGADGQEILMTVMSDINVYQRELMRQVNTDSIAELEKQGMTVTYPDKQAFIDATAGLRDELGADYSDTMAKILALA